MDKDEAVKLFEEKSIRTQWDEEEEKWYFSITDVCAVLADTIDGRNYWKVLKNRLKTEGSELVTECNQLKMLSSDGKYYKTDVADTEQLLRLIQSIPKTLDENKKVARAGGSVAKAARVQYEKKTGNKVITSKNAKGLKDIKGIEK
jgi:hypothetical protein